MSLREALFFQKATVFFPFQEDSCFEKIVIQTRLLLQCFFHYMNVHLSTVVRSLIYNHFFPNRQIEWNLESRNVRRAFGRWYKFSGDGRRAETRRPKWAGQFLETAHSTREVVKVTTSRGSSTGTVVNVNLLQQPRCFK